MNLWSWNLLFFKVYCPVIFNPMKEIGPSRGTKIDFGFNFSYHFLLYLLWFSDDWLMEIVSRETFSALFLESFGLWHQETKCFAPYRYFRIDTFQPKIYSIWRFVTVFVKYFLRSRHSWLPYPLDVLKIEIFLFEFHLPSSLSAKIILWP